LGKTITGAEGSRNAVIEWVRLTPPILHVTALVLIASACRRWYVSFSRSERSAAALSRPDADTAKIVLFAWLVMALILLPSLGGLPYFHRVMYFAALMVCLLVAVLTESEVGFLRARTYLPVLGTTGFIVGLFFIVLCLVYGVPDVGGNGRSPYLRRLWPFLLFAFAGVLVVWLTAVLSRERIRIVRLLIGSLLLAVLSDKIAIVTYGYQYSYGGTFPQGRAISHYTVEEIRFAQEFTSWPPQTLLLSDPYTLSILQAMTGLNGAVTFSNLGVMEKWYRDRLQSALSCLYGPALRLDCEGPSGFLAHVEGFLREFPGAWPEARYVIERRLGATVDHEAVRKDVVVILNRQRTLSWIAGTDRYFPAFNASHDWELDRTVEDYLVPVAKLGNDLVAFKFR
jgi:hypothetical protein